MTEYIDLDTPLELYVEHGKFCKKRISTLRELLDTNRIPYTSADVVERKTGEWEKHDDGIMFWWECSECHQDPWYDREELYDYCPSCGAKMEFGESEEE